MSAPDMPHHADQLLDLAEATAAAELAARGLVAMEEGGTPAAEYLCRGLLALTSLAASIAEQLRKASEA